MEMEMEILVPAPQGPLPSLVQISLSTVNWCKGLDLLRINGAKPMQKCLQTIFFKKINADIPYSYAH